MKKHITLTKEDLLSRINKLPRIRMAHLPTPLEEMPRLSKKLGGPRIFVKREDLTGLAFGGNKARHYDFELPHITDAGFDTIINIMDYHSNNARMTAAAANKSGLKYILVLKNADGREVQGNLLIDKLLGAELHLLNEIESENAHEYAVNIKNLLEAKGFRPYLLQEHLFPRIVGMVGFVEAGIELIDQIEANNLDNIHIFGVAGRSLCGLKLTAINLDLKWKFTGVKVTYDPPLNEYIFQHAGDIQKLLELPKTFSESDINILDEFVGEGYGIMTPAVNEAIHLAAQTDAIICDPNYTGTVMAAMIDQIRKGEVKKDETLIFLHTGGLPAVFTFARELYAWKG